MLHSFSHCDSYNFSTDSLAHGLSTFLSVAEVSQPPMVHSLWCILFGALLTLGVCFWPDHFFKSRSNPIARRHTDYGPFEATPDSLFNETLLRRDDFSCGPSKPCGNGACCGASGFCGYGPNYCGSGCVSNCGATAECGKFAKTPGKTCPLNTCCSQYGFVSHRVAKTDSNEPIH
jgi:hypothetical protein